MGEDADGALSRRRWLAGAGATVAGALGAGVVGARVADAAGQRDAGAAGAESATPGSVRLARFWPVVVRPGDPRYDSLVRGNNFRFTGQPEEIRVAGSAEQVRRVVGEAVRAGRRVAVRSGGHCFENLTAEPGVRVLLDLSAMDEVGYDAGRRAFSVQPGATLGQVYRRLHTGWGVTIPGGGCPEVGAGGHIAGGGYGPLSRRYGPVVDHLHAVEVVVVDAGGEARIVVASRDPADPNHDLWWAHTGGGGGNFGVVTRYWLRSPSATGTDPGRLLPASPQRMLQHVVYWPWAGLTERSLSALVRNFGRWHERNSAPGCPQTGVYGVLHAAHRKGGTVMLAVQVDADLPGAAGLAAEFVGAVRAGVDLKPVYDEGHTLPWLHRMTWPGTGEAGDVLTRRYKIKAGYLRRGFTERQLAAIHHHLDDETGPQGGGLLLVGYGGQANAVAPDATAIAQRDVVMKAVYQSVWAQETENEANIDWVRAIYEDVYRDTGGVPVPGEVSDGSYINYPDADLADPARNTSGVSAQRLYHKENYPRLQRVKARWDPLDVFRHALSVQLPG